MCFKKNTTIIHKWGMIYDITGGKKQGQCDSSRFQSAVLRRAGRIISSTGIKKALERGVLAFYLDPQ
jgi:hypothetical protein